MMFVAVIKHQSWHGTVRQRQSAEQQVQESTRQHSAVCVFKLVLFEYLLLY